MKENKDNSDNQSPKKDPITLAIENNPCSRCRIAGLPKCKCSRVVAGGAVGSDGGSGGSDKSEKSLDVVSASTNLTLNSAIKEFESAQSAFVSGDLKSYALIKYEAGAYLIVSDKLRGDLTFQIKSNIKYEHLIVAHEFFKLIQAEFNSFKTEMRNKGVKVENFTAQINADNNELKIHMPLPKYYDEFIKRLNEKNLLPVPNPMTKAKRIDPDNNLNWPPKPTLYRKS